MISGDEIKKLRKQAGFTSQASLANEINVSRSAVYDWERGKYFPEGKNLINLAKALNVSVAYLYGASGTKIDIPGFKYDSTGIEDLPRQKLEDYVALARLVEEKMIPVQVVAPNIRHSEDGKNVYLEWKQKDEQFIDKKAIVEYIDNSQYLRLSDIEDDSMENRFRRGDRFLWVEYSKVDSGDIAVVWLDNRIFVRGIIFDKQNIILKPINTKYPDITIKEDEDYRLAFIGKVIAEVPPLRMVKGIW